ncbi:MAG: HIT family protein [Candidatus Thermoplasmatota archaeon]|jgi:diadenosine tetraphosphate (Ap4A) HIT family hydrolase|nr:HIT family protein [Candidatus Thermoplasmatota archaeon]MDP7266410.1 HIT family protein [Candidatus Thermoplasmatota archaeon]MDP7423145.1 HIT family protein [bacterium]
MNEGCIFCGFEKGKDREILFSSKSLIAVQDAYPVTPGHILIITKKHRNDFFELNGIEYRELQSMILLAVDFITSEGLSPEGYNIGMNCGSAGGQTIMHFHCHVIPRYSGDMKEPRGGVRHCVAGKGNY